MEDHCRTVGVYTAECHDRDGNLLWKEQWDNTVVYAGQNQLLAQLQGNTTAVGPYMGLIGNQTTSIVLADTMASHAGWKEAGSADSPTYSGTRSTIAWNNPASGNISTSSVGNFTFTGSGNVTGAFIVFATGATSAIGNTSGTLLSAGNFSVAQPVINTNVLTVTYSLAL